MRRSFPNHPPFIDRVIQHLRARIAETLGRRSTPRKQAPLPQIPGYRIVKSIGCGGCATVYLALDLRHNDQEVAIKLMSPGLSADRLRRFRREVSCARAVKHPNVVITYKMIRGRSTCAIVMEYVPGKTLDHAIPRTGFPIQTCLTYAVQIARALSAIHAMHIIHRDVKPSNIKITREGVVKLLDFGCAKFLHDHQQRHLRFRNVMKTTRGAVIGTPGCMSPEQAKGRPTNQRSDVFSFGAIFYQMLTGRSAFREPTVVETMNAILTKRPRLPQRIPREIVKIVNRCLAKDSKRRYKSAKDLTAALENIVCRRRC